MKTRKKNSYLNKYKSIALTTILLFIILINLTSCNEYDSKKQLDTKIKLNELTINEIPKSINLNGQLLEAKRWNDTNGENLLIVTRRGPNIETGNHEAFSELEKNVELFAEQYVNKDGTYRLLWKIYDFELHCPFDIWIGLLPHSTRITDLDNNGVTETTLIYSLGCQSDVSPNQMKLLMHENSNKMGLRGFMSFASEKEKLDNSFQPDLSKIDTSGLSETDKFLTIYGRYQNENDFSGKPTEFLLFAKSLWLEFNMQDDFQQL